VFFDIPRLICMEGVLRRWIRHQFKRRTDLPEGCSERFSLEFVRWVWDYPRRSRPRIVDALAHAEANIEVLTITRRSQGRAVLETVVP
jgi:adenylate kinase family enzyme